MPNNILVSGRPGSGKTTLVVKLAEKLSCEGFKVAGFVTEEIRKGSHRVGFMVRDLGGDAAILAHIERKGKPRVGKYGVDVQAFEGIALQALETGKQEADLLVVDEIGRMEMASDLFRSAIQELISLPMPLLATMHAHRDDFTAALLNGEDIDPYSINPAVRDSLLEVIDGSLHIILEDRAGSLEPEGGKR